MYVVNNEVFDRALQRIESVWPDCPAVQAARLARAMTDFYELGRNDGIAQAMVDVEKALQVGERRREGGDRT